MGKSPITIMLDDMLVKLAEAARVYREAEQSVNDITNAIKAVVKLCEDEDVRNEYLFSLEELSGKPSFVNAIRCVLRERAQRKPLTPREIKEWISLSRKMRLGDYANPMAAIHTSLRRMKDVEEVQNDRGEKAYRLLPGLSGVTLPNQTDIAAERRLRPQERFKLEHTKGK